MKLTELSQPKKKMAQRALRDHYEIDIDLGKMDLSKTRSMMKKVKSLIKESTQSGGSTISDNASRTKLVMMEQMLSQHYYDLRIEPRIVVENEEVQKSQVILGAQDLVDQIQKMVEQVSKMVAEELPAVLTGISNEIGTSESEQFSSTANPALTTLQTQLTEAKMALSSSLSVITGESTNEIPEPFDVGDDEEIDDTDLDMNIDSEDDMELPDLSGDEEVEDEDSVTIGRERR